MTISTEPRHLEGINLRQLWLGVSAGPVLWALYHMLAYGLASMICKWGWLSGSLLGMPAGRLALIVLTVIFAAVVALAGFLSYGWWKRLRQSTPSRPPPRSEADEVLDPAGRFRFMALSGALLGAIFALTILYALVPVFLLDMCATQ